MVHDSLRLFQITKVIHFLATLPLMSKHRVSQITFHPRRDYLAVQSQDRSVEIFRIRTEDEVRKKQARRKRRAKEKKEQAKAKGKATEETVVDEDNADIDSSQEVTIPDLFTPYLVVRASGKVRSFDFADEETSSATAKGTTQIFMALANNALEVFGIPQPTRSKEGPPEAVKISSLDLPGHRADVRTLCLSSDDVLLASAANGASDSPIWVWYPSDSLSSDFCTGSLKIWNMRTTACIRTMECSFAICSTFLPGDRQVALGTKSGEILIYDIAASALVDTIKAHDGAVWSLHVRADGQAMVTGSADKDVKFWEFEQKPSESDNVSMILCLIIRLCLRLSFTQPRAPKIVSLVHVRTLKMTEDVLSVRYSPNGKLLAVALLDSTVKVFYQDSLKFFLSLYGHKVRATIRKCRLR